MKNERFKEIINSLKIETNKWLDFSEISSILLKNGRGIYPNWLYERFLIDSSMSNIFIKHGKSTPYGARLSMAFSFPYDMSAILYQPGIIVPKTQYYPEFRNPRKGDVIRATTDNIVISESIVDEVIYMGNSIRINLIRPLSELINYRKDFLLSFFDPGEYSKENCVHSTIVEGIYMKFDENKGNRKKSFGVFEEVIKIKNIEEISFKLTKTTVPDKILTFK